MKRFSPRSALASLLLGAALCGCQPRSPGAADLPARLLFVANGSYDAQADQRGKDPQRSGVRRVEWRTRPPLDAAAVTVEYDSEQRPRGWQLTLTGARYSVSDITGDQVLSVTTPQGRGALIQGGQLSGVLLLNPSPGHLRLLTRGYAVQHESALLPAFDPVRPGQQ